MVKIRLKRMGTTKRPFYRLVVANSRSPRDGRFIESLGFYDPLPATAAVTIDAERVREWLRRGARPSDSARDLLVAQGILGGDPRRRAPAPAAAATPAPQAATAPETTVVEAEAAAEAVAPEPDGAAAEAAIVPGGADDAGPEARPAEEPNDAAAPSAEGE